MGKVTIELDEYNKLRDFKKATTEGKRLSVHCDRSNVYEYFYTDDEMVKQLTQINQDQRLKIIDLAAKIIDLTEEIYLSKHPPKKEPTIYDIRKMSVREFRRWKKLNS